MGYEIWDEEGEKNRELCGRCGIWDCRFLIADFGLLILSSLFLAHLRQIQQLIFAENKGNKGR